MSSTTETVAEIQGIRLRPKRNLLYTVWRFALKKPLGAIGGVVLIGMYLMAIFADFIVPYDPLALHPLDKLIPPDSTYLMGTDYLGRDVLSRVIAGAKVSMYVGVMTVVIGTGVGSVLGQISGYFRGTFDLLVQRLVDAIQAFPSLILALGIVAMLGPSLENAIIAIAFLNAANATRVIRGSTMSINENQYVDAARAIGASHFRILTRYIFPNVTAPILILASVNLGNAILTEASLSFLGLGTQPPTPSWGRMLSSEGRFYMEIAPWLAIWPGVAISLAVLGINMFGDALRDVLDPKLRGR